MRTFFLFALPFLFAANALVAQTTQVLNSAIRAEVQFTEFWTNADGDDIFSGQDDPAMKIWPESTSDSDWGESCVTWNCDAPCTHSATWSYWIDGGVFDETLGLYLLAYESDNDEWCTWYDDDDFPWQGYASLESNGRIADSPEAEWDNTNGGAGGDEWVFLNSPNFDAKVRIVWRYVAGETLNNPLQFGVVNPGAGIDFLGSNLPNPSGQQASIDMGWQNNEGNNCPDVFFSFTTNFNVQAVISTDYGYTNYDSYLALYNSLGEVIATDDDGGTTGSGNKALLTTTLAPGDYRIRVEGYGSGDAGRFQLTINTTAIAPANDAACAAILIPADGTVQSGFTNAGATVAAGEDALVPTANDCINSWCETSNTVHNSVWFRFQAPASGAVEVSTCGMADFDTQIATYSVGDCGNYATYTLLAASDDVTGCSDYTSKMNVGALTPGQSYYILVDGWNGDQGDFSIQVTPIMASAAHEAEAASPLLAAYPNPTSGLLTVRLDDQLTMQACTLSDLTGKTVTDLRWTNPVQQTELDLGGLPPGVYLLLARSGERVFSEKIIVQ